MKKSAPKPEPQPTNVVCSLCGEPWPMHNEIDGEVTTLECIRLLKAKPHPPTIVYPQPIYPRPYQPYWVTQGSSIQCASQMTSYVNTPRVLNASAS